MRHGKKFNHLGRQKGHRRALLSNLSAALIEHKRIQTTVAKAKALRLYLEPLITKSKTNTTHSRRVVFGYLQNKYAVKELFDTIAGKVADRPGGYLRIVRIGFRQGDGAEMALIEFVDFNETYVVDKKSSSTGAKKKRTRRGKKKSDSKTPPSTEVKTPEEVGAKVTEVTAEAETVAEEVVAEVETAAEETVEEVKDVVAEASEEEVKGDTEEDKATDEPTA